MTNPIDEAAAIFNMTKMLTARAQEAQDAAFNELIALMPKRDEGSVTIKGESYKIAITYGMNRTIDAEALEAIKDEVPPELFEQAIKYKPALVLEGLRYLSGNEPSAYAILAQAITARPAKPSLRIEAIGVELQEAA